MLKKMRWRFIAAAMGAIAAVILILIGILIFGAYTMTVRQQDAALQQILAVDQAEASLPPQYATFLEQVPREVRSSNQFVVARFDFSGNLLAVGQSELSSLELSEAASYARNILFSQRKSGYYRGFRFLRASTATGYTVVMLDADQAASALAGLLTMCLLVALASLAAVFVLLLLLSKRVIAPYARNLETQKRFITDASHELKTPLTAIATSADVLAMEQEDNEWVQNIQSQSARLAKLIGNLVTLSRLDEEQPLPEKGNFSLSDAVWEIAEPIAAVAQAGGKHYTQYIEDGLTVYGNREAVQQMVSILLDNAIKYSDADGVIRLDVTRKQKKAEIQVFNTCPPLADTEHLERLFDRFYRPDESRSTASGGTGIGLAIAKATAEAHGGKIRVESRDGRSILFTVTL